MNQASFWTVTQGGSGYVCGKIHADGSMTVYKFLTREWAELCERSMKRLDEWENQRKFGKSTVGVLWSTQGYLTSSINQLTMTRFDLENKPVLVIDHNREVIKLDIPALVMIWLKTTWIPKFYKQLMWGAKGKNELL